MVPAVATHALASSVGSHPALRAVAVYDASIGQAVKFLGSVCAWAVFNDVSDAMQSVIARRRIFLFFTSFFFPLD